MMNCVTSIRTANPAKQYVLIVLLFQLIASVSVYAQVQPAVIPGDFADPSVIKSGSTYYAVGTSSEWAPHFPIFKSGDLVHWSQSGYVFNKKPGWTVSSFWAPEYYFHNNTYYIYYTARRKKDNISFIGVATSKYPDRGFVDHGVIIEHGKEAIDAFVFNDNGQLYITWKAYGLDQRPIEILGSKLSADGLSLTGEPFSLLKDDQRIGLEGQSILKKDGYFYLFYSAGNCCGFKCDYNVRVARSLNFQGPYEIYAGNPILQNDTTWKCPGHGTFVTGMDNRTYYLHHAYNIKSNVFTGRQGLLTELVWPEEKGWPAFKTASIVMDNAKTPADKNIMDRFKGKTISRAWQWDFRHALPVVSQQPDGLHLSGSSQPTNPAGAVFTLRPSAGQYTISTAVVNHNNSLKGLVIYGDANAAIGIGSIDNHVEYWVIKDNKRILLGSATVSDMKKPVELKLAVGAGFACKVYWKQQGAWQEIALKDGAYKIDFLPQWDRAPRPGLNYKGTNGNGAVFSFFSLEYTD